MTKDISPWKDREKISDLPKIGAFDWLEKQLTKDNSLNEVIFFHHCTWGEEKDDNGDLEKHSHFSIGMYGKEYPTLLEAIQAEVKKDAQN